MPPLTQSRGHEACVSWRLEKCFGCLTWSIPDFVQSTSGLRFRKSLRLRSDLEPVIMNIEMAVPCSQRDRDGTNSHDRYKLVLDLCEKLTSLPDLS